MQEFSFFSPSRILSFVSFFFPPRDAIEVQSGKNEKKIRANNEHLVYRPFTSNSIDQIDKALKVEDEWEIIGDPKSNDERGEKERYGRHSECQL